MFREKKKLSQAIMLVNISVTSDGNERSCQVRMIGCHRLDTHSLILVFQEICLVCYLWSINN